MASPVVERISQRNNNYSFCSGSNFKGPDLTSSGELRFYRGSYEIFKINSELAGPSG